MQHRILCVLSLNWNDICCCQVQILVVKSVTEQVQVWWDLADVSDLSSAPQPEFWGTRHIVVSLFEASLISHILIFFAVLHFHISLLQIEPGGLIVSLYHFRKILVSPHCLLPKIDFGGQKKTFQADVLEKHFWSIALGGIQSIA